MRVHLLPASNTASRKHYIDTVLNHSVNCKTIDIKKHINKKISEFQFGHGTNYNLTNTISIYSSYHCSRYNTQTNRLTETMFHKVIENIKLKILT